MNLKNEIEAVLSKPMDRQQFLVHMLVGLGSIVGLSALLRTLKGGHASLPVTSSSYSGGAYGGAVDARRR